jgi:hypothetical protein
MVNVAGVVPEPEKPASIVDQHFNNTMKLKGTLTPLIE